MKDYTIQLYYYYCTNITETIYESLFINGITKSLGKTMIILI